MHQTGVSNYVGSELELFARAVHWKSYWARKISPFVGARVLDVGAGLGATARVVCGQKQTRWLALEPDVEMAGRLRKDIELKVLSSVCEVRCGTLADLASSEKFDSILYIDVLEHIERDKDELEQASRHLADGGYIVVLSPAHPWLFTAFDKAVGHFRRYNRRTLTAATPPALEMERIFYLDSVGMLASMGNRFALRAAHPTEGQIKLWDNVMVPLSRLVDPVLGFAVGKSIVGVWSKR